LSTKSAVQSLAGCIRVHVALTEVRLADRRRRDGHKPGSPPVARFHQPETYRSELPPTHPPSVEQIASTYLTMPGRPSSCKVVLTKFTPWCVVESGGYAVMIASLVVLDRSGSKSNLVITKLVWCQHRTHSTSRHSLAKLVVCHPREVSDDLGDMRQHEVKRPYK
jgi:hypothetical protein